ncbi:MAG TPA: hypothetical protein P5528_11795 [Steroidobacteraceae bacterium]|nr:hypothetical protein [Steroidobacteraceae bacterium]HRX90115.1 hypothetical protein [Steroidobacteraceae bacterium]
MTANSKGEIQGEGDYEAARRYRNAVEEFVESADIDEAARRAKPEDVATAAELEEAEQHGKRRAKAKGDPDAMQQVGHDKSK